LLMMALISVNFGGQKNVWYMYFTWFWRYEMHAVCRMVELLGAQ